MWKKLVDKFIERRASEGAKLLRSALDNCDTGVPYELQKEVVAWLENYATWADTTLIRYARKEAEKREAVFRIVTGMARGWKQEEVKVQVAKTTAATSSHAHAHNSLAGYGSALGLQQMQANLAAQQMAFEEMKYRERMSRMGML